MIYAIEYIGSSCNEGITIYNHGIPPNIVPNINPNDILSNKDLILFSLTDVFHLFPNIVVQNTKSQQYYFPFSFKR